METGLAGRTVLITGANNPYGVGAATAKAFAARGAKILLHYFRAESSPGEEVTDSPGEAFYYRQQTKDAGEVLQALRDLGTEAHAEEADLADASRIPFLFDRAERLLGPIEILVNNAAAWEADTFIPSGSDLKNELVELWTSRPATVTAGSFDRLFAVNARAPVLMMAELARRHVARGASWGRIVNVSTAGAYVFPSEVSYGAGKLALEGYTRSAAMELGQFGITVNAVSLGPVQTGWVTPELEREILPTIPLGRIGTPEDVADVIVFLASEQARWVTGQRIFVGGGHGM
jgi:3-oxoacyl-[acyl-carrier protein] reductase